MPTFAIKLISSMDLPESFFSVHRLTEGLDVVPRILDSVRTRGDAAVREWGAKFDRANPESFLIPVSSLLEAEQKLKFEDRILYDALCLSRELAMQFAVRQRDSFEDFKIELSPGMITGQRTIAVERAGVYVPAGRFPLFSSVIMGSVPAFAAGVKEVILCTPPSPSPSSAPGAQYLPWVDEHIMAAASLCGIDRVYAIGGAQAIAAMAYGTESVPKVNVIVGPGNKYVAAAKKLVFGEVGIDLLAGPTEVMIIADDSANPVWVAADMLAQAEHDPDAQAILLTLSLEFARAVQAEITRLVSTLAEGAAARTSFAANGYIIVVGSYGEAARIANRKASEHLELALDPGSDREVLERSIHNYGSLFVGHRAAEVLGDYTAGLNHTLPTSGSASFTGGLSVRHFLKTVTTLHTRDEKASGWEASIMAAERIATAEGLTGHALAARCRQEKKIKHSPGAALAGLFLCLIVMNGCALTSPSSPDGGDPMYLPKVYEWFVSSQLANGLVPSSESAPSTYSVSLYDQALSAMVFMVTDDFPRARKILDYFAARTESELKEGLGGFYQFRSASGVVASGDGARRWLGDNAYLLAAVCNYEMMTGDIVSYAPLRDGLIAWIRSLQDTDGGLFYGSINGKADTLKIIECNIDAFGAVPGYADPGDGSFHKNILAFLKNGNWSSADGLLIAWDNAPNANWRYACDNISWALCAIEGFPSSTLEKAEARFLTAGTVPSSGAKTAGFCFDGDRDTIHPEATLGMAAAYLVSGNKAKADFYIAESEKLMRDGRADPSSCGLPYASGKGTTYGGEVLSAETADRPWVSSSAWYVFARKKFNPFDYARSRSIPQSDRFWE